jgi:hypothetical protein
MVDAKVTVGFGVAAAGLLILCASLAKIEPHFSAEPWQKDHLHPVAALAWAEAHCDSRLILTTGTPVLQRDDLLAMSGAFDTIEQTQGHARACTMATTRAAAVTERNSRNQGHIAAARVAQAP